jgi:hypothetical protein
MNSAGRLAARGAEGGSARFLLLVEPFHATLRKYGFGGLRFAAQQGHGAQRFLGLHDLGVSGKHVFLVNVFRSRLEYPALKRAVREQQNLFNASVVLIEDKATVR